LRDVLGNPLEKRKAKLVAFDDGENTDRLQ
jgi:hypothetical protein